MTSEIIIGERKYLVEDIDSNTILNDDDKIYVGRWKLIYSRLFTINYKSGIVAREPIMFECKKVIKEL